MSGGGDDLPRRLSDERSNVQTTCLAVLRSWTSATDEWTQYIAVSVSSRGKKRLKRKLSFRGRSFADESSRVFLQPIRAVDGSDYINASFIDVSSFSHNIDVVKSCQSYFGFSLPSEEWAKRAKNLDAKYIACERAFVHYGNTMFH